MECRSGGYGGLTNTAGSSQRKAIKSIKRAAEIPTKVLNAEHEESDDSEEEQASLELDHARPPPKPPETIKDMNSVNLFT